MLPLFMLALSYICVSFLFSVVVFFKQELVHNGDAKKRTYTGRYLSLCNQCVRGLEENPTFSINNSQGRSQKKIEKGWQI